MGKGSLRRLVVGGYYAVFGFMRAQSVPPLIPAKDYQRMSLLQYSIMMFFLLTMVALP